MAIVKMPDGALVEMPDNPSPEQLRALSQLHPAETGGLLDQVVHAAKVGGSALVRGALGLPSLLASGNANDYNERAYGPGSMVAPPEGGPPMDAKKPLEQVADIGPKPTSTAGKYAVAGLEGVGGTLGGPGGLVKNAVIGLGTGLGSEVGGQATRTPTRPDGNPLARILGGLAGGGGVALAQLYPNNARNIIKNSTKGVTEADFRAAEEQAADREAHGIPGLASQHLGPNSSLDDVVNRASGNQSVRPTILQATRDLSDKAHTAVKAWADSELPIQTDDRRSFLLKLQEAAAKREQDLLDQKNQVFAGKLPAGINGQVYPEAYMGALRKDILDMSKTGAFGNSTDGGRFLQNYVADKLATKGNGMSKTELGNLYNEIDAYGAANNYSGKAIRDLKSVIKSYTPEFQPARDAASAFFTSDVDPMRQGLAGDIAHARGGPSSDKYTASEIFINNIVKAPPAAIKKLAEDVGGENVGLVLHEYLMRGFEQAARSSKEGVQTPSTFRNLVYGTPSQRASVEAMLAEAAKYQGVNPIAARDGMRKFFDTLDSFKDLKIANSVDAVSIDQAAGGNIVGKVVAPVTGVRRFSDMLTTASTYQKIADMVTSPEGLKQIEAIARSKNPAYTQAIVRGLFATSGDNPPALQNSNPPK